MACGTTGAAMRITTAMIAATRRFHIWILHCVNQSPRETSKLSRLLALRDALLCPGQDGLGLTDRALVALEEGQHIRQSRNPNGQKPSRNRAADCIGDLRVGRDEGHESNQRYQECDRC